MKHAPPPADAQAPDRRTNAPRPPADEAQTPDAFEARLRAIGAARYHDRHPFHHRLHGGDCTPDEVRAWVINRFYYQSRIPMKDAAFMSRVESPALRREWRSRIENHDGGASDPDHMYALQLYKHGISLTAPPKAFHHNQLGVMLRQASRHGEAARQFSTAARIAPEDAASALFHLGGTHDPLGRHRL